MTKVVVNKNSNKIHKISIKIGYNSAKPECGAFSKRQLIIPLGQAEDNPFNEKCKKCFSNP